MSVPAFEAERAAFLESLRLRGQSPATLRSRGAALGAFFTWAESTGLADVREVTRETIRAYSLALRAAELGTATVHVRLIALRRFFEHLEARDTILCNPCAGLVLPRLENRLPRVILTRAETAALLLAPDVQTGRGLRDRAILELFYSTGLRLAELAALTLHDADLRAGFVRVRRGKGSRERVVPLGAKAAACLREYLAKVRRRWLDEALRHGEAALDERALWLSCRAPHRPLKAQMIQVMVKQYARAAGLEKAITPHVWRHTCATHLVSAGANLLQVKQLLGHRSLATTQIYARVALPEVQATHRRAHPRARAKA